MKFPISLDLRKSTLDLCEPFIRVIDAEQKHVMSIDADADGMFGQPAIAVDALNLIFERDSVKIRDLAVEVYKKLLAPGDLESMLRKDDDGGKRMRSRAGIYDNAVRATLEVLART